MKVIGTDYPNIDFTRSLVACNPTIEIGPPTPHQYRADRRNDLVLGMHLSVSVNVRSDFTELYTDNVYTLI